MTLNATGPISFGGSTVGQSINLELGVSATALASINSTPFRTLAAVPSGQISLSNFRGKSSNSYYLTYLGQNAAGNGAPRDTRGFAVSASSGQAVVPFYWSPGGNFGIGILNSSGGLQSTYTVGAASSGNFVIRMPLNNYGASDRVYIMDLSNEGVNYTTTASPSTFGWSTQPCSGLIYGGDVFNSASLSSPMAVTSSGRVLNVGWYEDPKSGFLTGVWPAESNGTQSTGGVWLDFGQGIGNYASLALKTDGTPVVFIGNYFFVFPSNLVSTGTIQKYGTPISTVSSAMCDSSNNMWIQCEGNQLQKVSAAYTSYTRYTFGPLVGGTINSLYGSAIYNDTIYMMGKYTTGSTSTNRSVAVWAFNTSTGTITWAKSITVTTGTSLDGGNNFRSVVANSSGVYVMLTDSRSGSQIYVMKIPLNGSLANTSYTLGGDTFTIGTPAGFTATVASSGFPAFTSNPSTFQQPAFALQGSYTLTDRGGSALTSLTTTPIT